MSDGEQYFGDSGAPEKIVGPDWDAIYKSVDGEKVEQEEDFGEVDFEALGAALRVLLRWVFQSGIDDQDGFKTRIMVLMWFYLPEIKILSVTDLGRIFKCSKQNISKSIDLFKRRFPGITNQHMR